MHRTLIILFGLILAACSGSTPPMQDIEASVQQALPGLLKLESLELENRHNVGSDANPEWVARAVVKVSLREATYDLQTVEDGVRILKPVRGAGESLNLYGSVHSERAGDSWRHRFRSDGSSNPVVGRPRADYGPDALVADSPQAKALLAKMARDKEQARIAEETRIAVEAAEQKRREQAEAAKRKRIEATVAKYGAGFAPDSLYSKWPGDGKTVSYLVTAKKEATTRSGKVYGTDLYEYRSDLARSIVHAGLLKPGETGIVEVTGVRNDRRSRGSPRNGIDSLDARYDRKYTLRLLERISGDANGSLESS
jgi:hypothetical protein